MRRFPAFLIALIYLVSATVAQAGYVINAYSVAPSTPVFTYIGSVVDLTTASTITFTNAAIGTAAADRFVVVGTDSRSSANQTISGMTIGGTSATLLVKSDTATIEQSGLFGLTVTSGTTATIVVTFSGNVARTTINVFTVTGLSSTTPVATLTDTTADPTGTLNVSAGGGVIAVAHTDSNQTCTWTGVDEDYDSQDGGSSFTSGHKTYADAQTPLTVTATFTGTAASTMSVVSLR